jgi:hypothetical protein
MGVGKLGDFNPFPRRDGIIGTALERMDAVSVWLRLVAPERSVALTGRSLSVLAVKADNRRN